MSPHESELLDHSYASCAVIIVTHNSQGPLPLCLKALKAQTRQPKQIILVDSGSQDIDYLREWESDAAVSLHVAGENIGFCCGNNRGMAEVNSEIKYVLFLNPDAFLTPAFIEKAIALMDEPSSSRIGAISGLLLGYNLADHQPTGRIDSMGIFRTWYGRWYDRGQGDENDPARTMQREDVPALCGALMFCRAEALRSVELGRDIVMDPEFFMYKEDIDLSLRLRRQGWTLCFDPGLVAYHCRGWKENRAQVPRDLRLLSAKNEMRLYRRMKSPCYLYSVLKYLLVRVWDK